MTGSIAEVALPDLLQLFSASKKTGVLQITTTSDVGAIYLEEGMVRFAVVNGDETVPPEKAFYRVLVWDTGTFDLLPKVEREFPTEITGSIEGLLMEGMRQLDEMRRLLNSGGIPEFEACATNGKGVFETLKAVAKGVLGDLKKLGG